MININIWDDYWEDGYVPDGEIQETFIYVDDTNIPLNEQSEIIEIIENYISLSWGNNILKADISKILLSDMCRLEIKNISHRERFNLLKDLRKSNLTYKGNKFNIYSES